jgi:hypothetical protein
MGNLRSFRLRLGRRIASSAHSATQTRDAACARDIGGGDPRVTFVGAVLSFPGVSYSMRSITSARWPRIIGRCRSSSAFRLVQQILLDLGG